MVEDITGDSYEEHFIHSILNPKSICTFGANNKLIDTMGSMQLRNIIAGGFKGNVYPIHPREEIILGLKAYKSVLDLPETPELAFLILPTKAVPQVMEECGQKGIKRLIITSGGFREVGEKGISLSKEIDEIASKYEMRFIGPNCLGVLNTWYDPENEVSKLNTFWPYKLPDRGTISIASQSGTIASHLFWKAKTIGAKFSHSLSVGNENNIDIVDCLDYFKKDPHTNAIGIYIEEIKRGKEFIELAKEITPEKPIVATYAGGSEASNRSVMSHTGSISGNDKIYEAVFKETGIISTNLITDFLNYLRVLSYGIYPKGKRIGILSDSGGSASMMAKLAEQLGLVIPRFSKELESSILKILPHTGSAKNPIDLTFDINQYNLYVKLPKILLKSGEIDALILYGVFDFEEIVKVIETTGQRADEFYELRPSMPGVYLKPLQKLVKKLSIPVFYVGPQEYSNSWYQEFVSRNIPIFDMWDQPVKCMKILCEYAEIREKLNKVL